MYTAISVLVFIICLLLILIVLVQNSKGGGLASSFASSNQIMGVRKTTDFLEKATWTLAAAMMVLCVVAVFTIDRSEVGAQSSIEKQLNAQPIQQSIPDFSGAVQQKAAENSGAEQGGQPAAEEPVKK